MRARREKDIAAARRGHMRQGRCRAGRRRQQGFGLTETLIAALCFAVSLLGLLQYHQALQQAFLSQWQQKQAWRLAWQQLSYYEARGGNAAQPLDPARLAGASGWRFSLTEQRQTVTCRRVVATVITPHWYQAQLARWFC